MELDATVVAAAGQTPGTSRRGSSATAAVATARRLATLDAEVACFGHAEPLRRDAAARRVQAVGRP